MAVGPRCAHGPYGRRNIRRRHVYVVATRSQRCFMKKHSQLLITTFFMAALLFTGAALSQTPGPNDTQRMKAIVYHNYGSPDVLRLEEIEKPVPNDDQVLIRVRAASVNPLDWHVIEGAPYIIRLMGVGLIKPKETQPGDDVFGGRTGAFAEYVSVPADRAVVLKPSNMTFEQAASVPIAAITALQGLRDKGKIQPGQKVLINGASGGVGTFAVQIAKSFGADVTGVCSTRNVDMVRSIGADHVIDYTQADFTQNGQRYDLILDNVANHSLLEYRRILNPRGKYVLIGGGGLNDGRWIGALARPITALVLSRFVTQDMGMMLAQMTKEDLTVLRDLMQAGKVTPVIDRTYSFSQVPEAVRYLEEGHARGKVVITMEPKNQTSPVSANLAADSGTPLKSYLIALALIGIVLGVSIVPVVVALLLNRQFRRRHTGYKPFRWGYYFS